MRGFLILAAITVAAMCAQPPVKADLLKLSGELENAIASGDWPKAAQLSAELKKAVEGARDRSMAAAGSELTDSILSWMPTDIMTFVVAERPFRISLRDQTQIPTALEVAQSCVTGLLAAAEKESLYKDLTGRAIRMAALGARHFGEDSGDDAALGMIPYQGCAVYAFAEPLAEPLLKRPPEDTILGHRVWVSKGTQNDTPGRESYFVSMLKPDLLLACNHRGFFQEMVSRMGLAAGERALPANLPEWKQVDRSVPLWGIAHYRGSPVPASLAPDGPDPGATGLTVEFGVGGDETLARMIAKSDPWSHLEQSPEFRGAAKSRNPGDGVWELKIEGRPDVAGFAAFALMAELGFVVLL